MYDTSQYTKVGSSSRSGCSAAALKHWSSNSLFFQTPTQFRCILIFHYLNWALLQRLVEVFYSSGEYLTSVRKYNVENLSVSPPSVSSLFMPSAVEMDDGVVSFLRQSSPKITHFLLLLDFIMSSFVELLCGVIGQIGLREEDADCFQFLGWFWTQSEWEPKGYVPCWGIFQRH